MKKRKIIIGAILVAVTFFAVRSLVWAQKTQEEKVQHITERMAKKLDLTNEQKEAVYDLNLERAKGHEEAHAAGRDKEMITMTVKEWEEGLRQVLDEKQLKKLNLEE